MAERINCWDFFSCAEKDCPVLIQKEPCCWLVSGTFCRKEIQGLFTEKMEMCLECAVFQQNIDPAHLRETLRLVSLQFRATTQALRDRELKETNSELAMGLCQHYDTLNRIAGGDLSATANEDSDNELIAKLGQLINKETRTRKKAEEELAAEKERLAVTLRSIGEGVITTDMEGRSEELLKYEKLKSLGVLAGGIAHDFNNILTGIMGNISLAKMFAQDAEKVRKRLDEAEKASYLARELTQQLLTFSRGGAPVKTTASMAEYVQETVNFVLRGSKLRGKFVIPADVWPVDFDQGQFQQVIHNLVINADQAMPEGGILQVGMGNKTITADEAIALPEGRYVQIWFTDQGIGIPKENLSKVFDPFFTTRPGAGGLGLSMVYSIIKRHDGLITADSENGKGATFRLTLPASGKAPPVQEEASSTLFRGQGRILVMDDEPIVREVLGEMLTRLGFEVEYAQDGAEAVKIYRVAKKIDQPFDLLIMDLTVAGGMGGLEALERLLEVDPNVRAIASSGYSSDPVMSDFQAYGFKGVMAKPYTLEELSRALASLPNPEMGAQG